MLESTWSRGTFSLRFYRLHAKILRLLYSSMLAALKYSALSQVELYDKERQSGLSLSSLCRFWVPKD